MQIRLSQAARKLNIGKDAIVDALSMLGIEIENNPNAKLSGETFRKLNDLLSSGNLKRELEQELISPLEALTDCYKERGNPEFIYKYYRINDFFKESLKSNYIFYSSPNQFNDPLDCYKELVDLNIDFGPKREGFTKKKKNEINKIKSSLLTDFQERIDKLGIACFTTKWDNPPYVVTLCFLTYGCLLKIQSYL